MDLSLIAAAGNLSDVALLALQSVAIMICMMSV